MKAYGTEKVLPKVLETHITKGEPYKNKARKAAARRGTARLARADGKRECLDIEG